MLDCCIAKKLNRIMPECRYTMTANVLQLGEVADLETLTFNLALMFI